MPINIHVVTAIIESAQEAWNAGSVDGVIEKYVDDVVYTTNTGGANGEPLTIRGKEDLRVRFQAAQGAIASTSRVEFIRLEKGLVRTRLNVQMRHRETGISETISLRQILKFRGFLIAEQQDFHDAAKVLAFWRLLGDPLRRPSKPESV